MEHSREEIETFLALRKGFLSSACEGNIMGLQVFSMRNFGASYELLRTDEGCNALNLAAYHGQTEACKYLIKNLKFDVNYADNEGDTPLFQAIYKGHWPTAVYLIENGADVTKSNSMGSTPLHYAAKQGSKEFVDLLLSRGADINATSQLDKPLHIAAMYGNAAVLKSLLERHANPNSISPMKMSPLLYSMRRDSIECMELLLKAGADPEDIGPQFQTTPLCFAASKPNKEMVSCLLKYNANPNTLNQKGKKALEYAAMANCSEMIELLYPDTEPIASYPEWSISGIMQHAQTKQAKQKELCLQAKENGNKAFARRNYADAIDWYTKAVEADSTDAKILSNRSMCWACLNKGHLALIDAQTCIELDPGWSKAHYREGAAWNVLKDYEKAAEAFARALELEPRNEEIEKAYRAAQAKHDNDYY